MKKILYKNQSKHTINPVLI